MKHEIERKFLIMPSAKWAIIKHCEPPAIIAQGYISTADPEIRIRTSENYSVKDILTIKFGSGISRPECNIPVSPEKADELWRAVMHPPMMKNRYRAGRWEIDVFTETRHGGLILAECELDSILEPLPDFPEWLGFNIAKEVTDDPKYKNKNLAQW